MLPKMYSASFLIANLQAPSFLKYAPWIKSLRLTNPNLGMFSIFRREVLPDGILYASRDSHYSVFKAARMYRMEAVKVDTHLSGEIDCADLERKLIEGKDKPAILNVNIGKPSSPPVTGWLRR